jgi:Amt family ammonium transporter
MSHLCGQAWRLRGLSLSVVLLAALLWVGAGGLAGAQEGVDAAVDEAIAAAVEIAADAEEEEPTTAEGLADAEGDVAANVTFAFNNVVLFFCAVLVIFMQAGFAMLEAGMNPSKHVVNILCKNVIDFSLGVLLFFTIGYAIMYPGWESVVIAGGWLGIDTGHIFNIPQWDGVEDLHPQIDFLFQAAFAATAATIVSGAVAGRMKFGAYLVYSAALTAVIYPISGSWLWGEGWLDSFGFVDFAGSVLVHAVGGFAGLAGAIVLGPRIGRFAANGDSTPIPGHNMSIAALGTLILLIGWYGFNPGSVLAFANHADAGTTMTVAVNTTLAAGAGCLACMLVAWGVFGKPDLSMALNGLLGGLVGITANADIVSNQSAIIIGLIAGVLVVLAVVGLEKCRIDDPVGAFPVHGVCGIWGCIAAAVFSDDAQFVPQLVGSLVVPAFAFITMFALFSGLKAINFLRVTAQEEQTGLDISEHGMHAYPAESAAIRS